MQDLEFTQENLLHSLTKLPADVVRAGELANEIQYNLDMLALKIAEQENELKDLKASLYIEFKTGTKTLPGDKVTEGLINSAVDLDGSVKALKNAVLEDKKRLAKMRQDYADAKVRHEALAFTKANSMGRVHQQMMREAAVENIIDRMDDFDRRLLSTEQIAEKFSKYKKTLVALKKELDPDG